MLKGCGRATGQALLGGGLLSDVPIFKELSKCGKSLGDVMGGGDDEQAGKRWTEEYLQEISDPTYLQKAGVSIAGITSVTVVTVCTAGLGTAAFLGAVATAGVAAGGAASISKQYIDTCAGKRDHVDAGEVFGLAAAGGIVAVALPSIPLAEVNEPVAKANKVAESSQSKQLSIVDTSICTTRSSGSVTETFYAPNWLI